MFDPLSAIVGVVIFFIGFLVGRRRRRADPRGQVPAQPFCGCGDHLSVHDPETGRCHAVHMRRVKPKGGKDPYDEPFPCPCRRYVGPEQIRDVWVPPPAIDPGKLSGE
jgi:hypothetical protein